MVGSYSADASANALVILNQTYSAEALASYLTQGSVSHDANALASNLTQNTHTYSADASSISLQQFTATYDADALANLLATFDTAYSGNALGSNLTQESKSYNADTLASFLSTEDHTYDANALALNLSTGNHAFNADALATAIAASLPAYAADSLASALANYSHTYNANALGSVLAGFDHTYQANATASPLTQQDKTYNVNALALSLAGASHSYNANTIAGLKTIQNTNYSANATAIPEYGTNKTYNANSLALELEQNSHTYQANTLAHLKTMPTHVYSADAKALNLGQNQQAYQANANALNLINPIISFSANSVAIQNISKSYIANAIAARKSSMIIAHRQENNFVSPLLFSSFSPVQGSASGATANNPNTLFAWIQNVSGTNHVYGRLDNPEFEPSGSVPTTDLSTETGMEGVKVCHFPSSNKWAVVWKRGADIKFRIFDSTLNPLTLDVSITSTAPAFVTPDHFDIGATRFDKLIVVYSGNIKIIDINTLVIVTKIPLNTSSTSANKIAVHQNSGNIDILYASSGDLIVDRYDVAGDYAGSFGIAISQSGVDPLLMDAVCRTADDSLFICWIANNELRYRIISPIGTAITAIRTIDGANNIDLTDRSLFVTIGELENHFSLMVKVTSSTYSFLAWIRPDENLLSNIIDEQIIHLSAEQSSPTPINGVNEFQFRHLYNNAGEIAHEIYVNSSVYMGLWRIERQNRTFVDSVSNPNPYINRDGDASTILQSLFSGYVGGNRLSGSTGTSEADYNSAPGRSLVDINSDAFNTFLGTTNEDTMIIGGPLHSEVAEAIQANLNLINGQMQFLEEELETTNVRFTDIGLSLDGLAYGLNSFGLEVVNNHGTFQLRRQLAAGTATDYAIILRMSVSQYSTQENIPQNQSLWYIAGITTFSTEAAAFTLTNPERFRLGQSSALLAIIKYPDGTTSYVPDTTPGTIVLVPLKDVNADNFDI